jgi:hypothetical protein
VRVDRLIAAAGTVLLSAGLVAASAGVADATFGGAGDTNGDIAFVGNCNGGNQQILYVNPAAVSNPPPSCSGYGEQTLTGTDAEPFYSADSKTVYFESSRSGSFAIYSIPSVFSGNVGDGTPGDPDGATQLTFPTGSNQDFAPTISSDGTTLGFVRCGSSPNSCALETMVLATSVVTTQTTDFPLTNVSSLENGNEDRPEFDPVNANQILYECAVSVAGSTYGHICLHTLGTSTGDVDLSNEAESTNPWPATDENPDFKYDGSAIVFDTSGGAQGPNMIYKMAFNPVTGAASGAAAVWSATGQGHEIEPIFSPNGAEYAWAHYGSGTQVVTWDIGSFANAEQVSPSGKSISSQPTWEGTPGVGTNLPEAPYALLLPGGGLLTAGVLLGLRRRRQSTITAN